MKTAKSEKPNFITGVVGGKSRFHQQYPRNMFIAIEVTNNSPVSVNLEYAGIYHRHKLHEGLKTRLIIGNKISEREGLSELFDLLIYYRFMIYGFLFNTSHMYDMFRNKQFIYGEVDSRGQQYLMTVDLDHHAHCKSESGQTVGVDTAASGFIARIGSIFTQTNIKPGERLLIVFDTHGRRMEHELRAMIDRANSIYNKEKQRKIFLIM